jgi:hypothetical protein
VAGVWQMCVHFGFRSLDSCAGSGFHVAPGATPRGRQDDPDADTQAAFTETSCIGRGERS